MPRGSELPQVLELRFGPAGSLQTLAPVAADRAAGRVDCPVDDDGGWRCEVPEGIHDMGWHAPGFASVLRWQVPVVAGETVPVDALSLVPGGAILGIVEANVDARDAAAGTARIPQLRSPSRSICEVAGDEAMQYDARRHLGYLRQSRPVGPDGSFQFTGLPPGMYRITARAEGMAQAQRPLVEVQEGRESRLVEPLRLQPLVVQEVRVVPPRTPAESPWTVSLHLPGGQLDVAPCRTDPTGSCNLNGVPAGEYQLRVEDLPGSVWREEWVNLAPHGRPLEIELPVVPIEGRITLGGEPARARMVLRREDDGSAVEIFSDPQGRFHGHLPGEGDWRVTAFFRAHGAQTALGTHSVLRPGDGGPAWLELELPDTVLRGRVVGPDGQGLRGAAVSVLRRPSEEGDGRNRARSDEKGWFWMWGLAEGTYVARALGGHSAATSDEFELREGETGEVVVRLGGSTQVRGRVVALSRPVAGAEVHMVPQVPLGEMPGIGRSVTGPDGVFEAEVPEGTTAVTVTVLAPGEAARIVLLPLPDDGELEVDVQPLGGTLHLRDPGGRLVAGTRIEHDGASTWLGTLLSWPALYGEVGRLGGESFTLPMMEPGAYRFCSTDPTRCAEGRLEPGGELELVVGAADGHELDGEPRSQGLAAESPNLLQLWTR